VARLLLERGAMPDDGESLYHAAQHDHRECLEVLLANGANLSGQYTPYGNTPLHFLAAHRESNSIAPATTRGMQWLLEHGADPNVPSVRSASGTALPGGRELPLHRAALSGRGADVMRLLVEHGAMVDAPRGDGVTAYALAIRSGNTAAAAYLAGVGADVSRLEPIDRLLGACSGADLAAARALVATHANLLDTLTAEDRQLLGTAVGDEREDVVRTMLAIGWPMADEGEWGGTPLHWAAWNARVAMVRLLLEHGAPVNVRDSRYGSSPIAWAAHGSRWNGDGSDDDYVTITTLLLDAGATRPEAFNNWGEAPESFARPAVLEVLKARGFAA
jgi:ankyrin repeat protein